MRSATLEAEARAAGACDAAFASCETVRHANSSRAIGLLLGSGCQAGVYPTDGLRLWSEIDCDPTLRQELTATYNDLVRSFNALREGAGPLRLKIGEQPGGVVYAADGKLGMAVAQVRIKLSERCYRTQTKLRYWYEQKGLACAMNTIEQLVGASGRCQSARGGGYWDYFRIGANLAAFGKQLDASQNAFLSTVSVNDALLHARQSSHVVMPRSSRPACDQHLWRRATAQTDYD